MQAQLVARWLAFSLTRSHLLTLLPRSCRPRTGDRDIATTARVQERVLTTVYAKLQDNGVLLEGSLLKPSMTVPGVDCADKSDPATIAKMTVQTLDRSLPSS